MLPVKKVFARFLWLFIAAFGAWAFLALASHRGEEINSIYILAAALCSLKLTVRLRCPPSGLRAVVYVIVAGFRTP